MNAKKLIALLLAVVMTFALAACGGNGAPETTAPADDAGAESSAPDNQVQTFEGDFTYTDHVGVLSANWNPHTYQTQDEAYPIQYLTAGLYTFVFNDELHPVEGKEPYAGYKIVPEMAAEMPIDVTEQMKAEHPEFGIPESADAGFAYTIKLNPNAVWQDGTPIKAVDYVESMKRLLDPKLGNYRAGETAFEGAFRIHGAENYANAGHTVPLSLNKIVEKSGAESVDAVRAQYAEAKGFINWQSSFGVKYDFDSFPWASGDKVNPDGFTLEPTGKPEETPLSLEEAIEFFIAANVATGNSDEATATDWVPDEILVNYTYPADVAFDTVALFSNGEYEITFVLDKSIAGFNLLYKLTSNWLVKTDLYDSCLKEEASASGSAWTSTYNTSVETTQSYGPYKLVNYQTDKGMRFERNENWYGYKDGKHVYVDPNDGLTYPMYQTTAIDTQVVAEVATAKLMFLKGQLMTYGLQPDDFDTYRNSEYCYFTPGTSTFFLILNGNMPAIQKREAASDFDKSAQDLEMLTLKSFHRALGLTYDKDKFVESQHPSRSPGFGLIGNAYIYDPDTGARYRDTEQAMQTLCDVYGVDTSKFASLKDAVNSITGYDPVAAKEFYQQAYNEGIEKGFITDANGDGKCDQKISIMYAVSGQISDRLTQMLDYLTAEAGVVTAGTPFENCIEFVPSAPLGNAWSDNIKGGLADIVLGGWTGSAMDPFNIIEVYTNPAYQYDRDWFDSSSVDMTLTIDGKEVTMSLQEWTKALNGTVINKDGVDYNFGAGIADPDVRLDILAGIEKNVLLTYNYLPMLEDGSMALVSQKMFYVVEEHNPVLGRGGVDYIRYNYDDAAWDAYVAEQGGELTY